MPQINKLCRARRVAANAHAKARAARRRPENGKIPHSFPGFAPGAARARALEARVRKHFPARRANDWKPAAGRTLRLRKTLRHRRCPIEPLFSPDYFANKIPASANARPRRAKFFQDRKLAKHLTSNDWQLSELQNSNSLEVCSGVLLPRRENPRIYSSRWTSFRGDSSAVAAVPGSGFL